MSNVDRYMVEVKELIKAYGLEPFAKVLGLSGRGVQYWLAEKDPKIPSKKTQIKIHELFVKHQSGNGIAKPQEPVPGDKSELLDIMRERIKELKEDKDWLKKNLEFSLTGIAIGNKSILAHVATILEKDNEREAGGNKKKEQFLKEDADRRIGEKLSGFQQMDNSLNT